MQKLQSRLTVSLFFTAAALIAFFVTAFISAPIDFMYGNAAGLSTTRNVALVVSLVALVVLLIAGFMITVPLALQPARLIGKVGKVLPVYLMLFTIVGIISALLGVGQTGNLFNLQGVGQITLIAAWLGLAAVLTTIVVVIATARAKLSPSTVKSAARVTAVSSGLTAVATVAMLASVVIVATSQPRSFGGPGGGFPGGEGGNRPGGAGQTTPGQNNGNRPNGQVPEATSEAPAGFPGGAPPQGGSQPEATGEPQGARQPNGIILASAPVQAQQPASTPEPQATTPSGQGQRPERTNEPQGGFAGRPEGGNGGFPDGGFPPGGGPGGGTGSLTTRYAVGGALMTIFAVIGLIGAVGGLTSAGQVSSAAWASPIRVNYPREAGLALVTAIGITVVVLAVIQVVPVTRDNPPVKTPITWDSDQTKQLVYAACMDCHSNETTWPWYASIAPSSWLTTLHVHDARQEMNLSELDNMPAFQRRRLAENMAEQIRMGSMPPKDYLILHPEARLTDEQKQQLIEGLQKSLASS